MNVTTHDFRSPGSVSVWATLHRFEGVHEDFLEGCDQLFMWLLVDYDVAVDGPYATNFAPPGKLASFEGLVRELHASEHFSMSAAKRARERGVEEASFVVALYDCEYDPGRVGLAAEQMSEYLTFVGAFRYEP